MNAIIGECFGTVSVIISNVEFDPYTLFYWFKFSDLPLHYLMLNYFLSMLVLDQ